MLCTQKEETASQPQVKTKEQIDPMPAKSRKPAKSTAQEEHSTKHKLTVVPPTKTQSHSHLRYTCLQGKDEKTCEPEKVMTCDLTISSVDTEDKCLTTVGYENLALQDLTLLEQKRGWLNDQLINVGQMLLKKQVHHYRWFAKR